MNRRPCAYYPKNASVFGDPDGEGDRFSGGGAVVRCEVADGCFILFDNPLSLAKARQLPLLKGAELVLLLN